MVSDYANPLARLISRLEAFPGVGAKSAERIAFFILNMPEEEAEELAAAIISAKKEIRKCRICFNYSQEDICSVCADHKRNTDYLCVVSDPRDIITMERTHEYHGLYHVLGGLINPSQNVLPDDLNIKPLVKRVEEGTFREVIMALNSNTEGDVTSLYLARQLKGLGVKVTRIGSGMPVGGEIDYADQATMIKAIEWRREINVD